MNDVDQIQKEKKTKRNKFQAPIVKPNNIKKVKHFHNICSSRQKHFIVWCLFIDGVEVDIGANGT